MNNRSDFELSLPGREDDEDDATEKQLSYIRHLMRELEVDGFPDSALQMLGKWQASALIDSLMELKEGDIENSRHVSRVESSAGGGIWAAIGIAVVLIVIWLLW